MAGEDTAATILKILNGVQSGVDVALLNGSYTLGSSDDDDIQIFDVSLKPGHARISVEAGKITVAGGAGQLRTRNGLVLEPGGEPQEIEQLDVLSAGTTRFALGARTANWPSITDADRDAGIERPELLVPVSAQSVSIASWRSWRSALPIAAVLVLAVGGVAAYPYYGAGHRFSVDAVGGNELEAVRSAVHAFSFGRGLKVEQEVDGAVFVTGFVDKPVERRAIVGAVKELNIPARVRIAVRDVMRDDVASLIEASGYKVTPALSDDGKLTLTGVILDPQEADDLSKLLRDRVMGLSGIDSQIKTAPSLLAEAKTLAQRSQIDPLVLLRVDNNSLLEASGVIPTQKIDAWVGFLQAYANQFGDSIPLRSLVRLQNPDGTISEPGQLPGEAIYVGEGTGVEQSAKMDMDRIRSGKFDLSDIFIGQKLDAVGGSEHIAAEGAANTLKAMPISATARDGKIAGFDLDSFLAPSGATLATVNSGSAGISAKDKVLGARASHPGSTVAGTAQADANAAEGSGSRNGTKIRKIGETAFWTPAADTPSAASLSGPLAGNGGDDVGYSAEQEQGSSATTSSNTASGSNALGALAETLIRRWSDKSLGNTEAGRRLEEGMKALEARRNGLGNAPKAMAERYAVLLARGRTSIGAGEQCWSGSRLTQHNVSDALFWLDLFSVSDKVSLRDLSAPLQRTVLEAALNPRQTSACALLGTGQPSESVYLDEISRNNGFIAFIARDLESFPLDVAGVSLSGDRFVQTRTGQKMKVGYAPDQTSRVALVGELGVAVERSTGFSTSIFGPELNWMTQ